MCRGGKELGGGSGGRGSFCSNCLPPPTRMLATDIMVNDDSNALSPWLVTVCQALKCEVY